MKQWEIWVDEWHLGAFKSIFTISTHGQQKFSLQVLNKITQEISKFQPTYIWMGKKVQTNLWPIKLGETGEKN